MQPSNYVHATRLAGTAAINCKAGVCGAPGPAGLARDTEFLGCYIDLTAVAGAVLTVGGFGDNTGAAAPWLINGQISLDQNFFFPWPLLNEFGPLIFTPSVANAIWVFTRAYTGP